MLFLLLFFENTLGHSFGLVMGRNSLNPGIRAERSEMSAGNPDQEVSVYVVFFPHFKCSLAIAPAAFRLHFSVFAASVGLTQSDALCVVKGLLPPTCRGGLHFISSLPLYVFIFLGRRGVVEPLVQRNALVSGLGQRWSRQEE